METRNQTRSLPGRPRLAADPDGAGVEGIRQILVAGQRTGELGDLDPHVAAVMFRQAIDAAVLEAALNPDVDLKAVDLKAFAAELVGLFDRAIRAPDSPRRDNDN